MNPTRSLIACAALAVLVPMTASASLAQQSNKAGSYCAFLSDADHHNSKGARLTTAGQVLRQDRANFHRYGIRDEYDDTDDLFMSADNRALMEKLASRAGLTKAQQDYIVGNETYVCVYADTTAGGNARLEVTLPE